MDRRYRLLASCNVRHLDAFNRLVDTDLEGVEKAISTIPRHGEGEIFEAKRVPYLIIVVDELADLMMTTGPETEESIACLAQARAVGIHLVLATQRPSVDVLTGTIKANFPARIAYRVSSRSTAPFWMLRVVSGCSAPGTCCSAPGECPPAAYPRGFHFRRGRSAHPGLAEGTGQSRVLDKSVIEDPRNRLRNRRRERRSVPMTPCTGKLRPVGDFSGQGSTSFLQRRMRLGYSRAARIIDAMEQEGILGPSRWQPSAPDSGGYLLPGADGPARPSDRQAWSRQTAQSLLGRFLFGSFLGRPTSPAETDPAHQHLDHEFTGVRRSTLFQQPINGRVPIAEPGVDLLKAGLGISVFGTLGLPPFNLRPKPTQESKNGRDGCLRPEKIAPITASIASASSEFGPASAHLLPRPRRRA